MSWRYLVQRLGGEAHGEIFETELPISGFALGRALSAPPAASGTIAHEVRRLKAPDGELLLKKWGTAIYPVADDQIRAGYILTNNRWTGSAWSLSLAGFSSYANGMPYGDVREYVDTDPLDIWREIWRHLQDQPGGQLDLRVGDLTSPARIGAAPRQVEFTTGSSENVSFEANDRSKKLVWWETFDCGRMIDDIAREGPFDWVERHEWDDNAVGGIAHYLDPGYPTIGGRKDHLRLVFGENVMTEPEITDGDTADYATEVHVLGAGEGKDRVRGFAGRGLNGGLRRAKVVEDRNVDNQGQADKLAQELLGRTRGEARVNKVVVVQHSNADINELQPGDEVPYYAETENVLLDMRVRIVNIETRPDQEDQAVLTVVTA